MWAIRENFDGDWEWDGHGSPRDHAANSITRLKAYDDKGDWESLVAEYESQAS